MTNYADRAGHKHTYKYSVLVWNTDRRKTSIIIGSAAILVSSDMHVLIALDRGYTPLPTLSLKESCCNYSRACSLLAAN